MAGFLYQIMLYTHSLFMPEDLSSLTIEELNNLFIEDIRRFMKGIDTGLPFDALKEIRVKLHQIEAEIKGAKFRTFKGCNG